MSSDLRAGRIASMVSVSAASAEWLGSSKAISRRMVVLVALFVGCSPMVACPPGESSTPSTPAPGKVEKEFYSAKDRSEAMHSASLFTAKPVSEAAILEGPSQNPKQFRLHFNDKVI